MSATLSCYYHPSNPAVVQCEGCQKGLCKTCCDVAGSWCRDCLISMAKENGSVFEGMANKRKKERLMILIPPFIGTIAGIVLLANGTIPSITDSTGADYFIVAWLGAGLALGIFEFFTRTIPLFPRAWKTDGFKEAMGIVFIGGPYLIIKQTLGGFISVLWELFTRVVRDIKKFSQISEKQVEAIIALENYFESADAGQSQKVNVNDIIHPYKWRQRRDCWSKKALKAL